MAANKFGYLWLDDDPTTVRNYHRARPDPSTDFEIEYEYDHNYKKSDQDEYYWCCHCQKRTHFSGWILRDSDDLAYAIGVDCAVAHYGELVAKQKIGDFRVRQRHLRAVDALRWLKESGPSVAESLSTLRDHPEHGAFRQFRTQISEFEPELGKLLGRYVREGGQLYAEVETRDLEAERKKYESIVERLPDPADAGITLTERKKRTAARNDAKRQRSNIVIMRAERQLIGALPQPHVLDPQRDPANRLRDAIALVQAVNAKCKELEEGQAVAIEKCLAQVKTAIDQVSRMLDDRNNWTNFCGASTGQLVARWWSAASGKACIFEHGAIVLEDGRRFPWPTSGFGLVDNPIDQARLKALHAL